MITPSFGLTATERVLPKLALDFTTASLDSRITFTRTTGASNPATYVNSSGYITATTNNQPRFDYDPVTLACKGLLIEESRENKILYSDQISTANWTTESVVKTGDTVISPDGTQNADTIADNSSNTVHQTRNVTGIAIANAATTASVYLKNNTRQYGCLSIYDGATYHGIVVDLINGTITQTNGTLTSSSVTAAGNGWYRLSITKTINATTYLSITTSDSATPTLSNGRPSYAGNGSSIYAWGAQLEAGAFATSYIPTTSASLTRNADVATMTGTNFSDWWNASQGAIEFQFIRRSNAVVGKYPYTGYILTDANNRFDFYQNSNVNENVLVKTSGSNVASFTSTLQTGGTVIKQSLGYATNNFAYAVNGSTPQLDTNGAVPSVSSFYIGCVNSTGAELNGWIQKINYWPQRLTNAEIQAFSK